jgi:hypothetical protein
MAIIGLNAKGAAAIRKNQRLEGTTHEQDDLDVFLFVLLLNGGVVWNASLLSDRAR